MTGLMTLNLTTPNAWYNVRLAKSIGEFPHLREMAILRSEAVGYRWGIEMSSQGISR
jgi:hypothetical protein